MLLVVSITGKAKTHATVAGLLLVMVAFLTHALTADSRPVTNRVVT